MTKNTLGENKGQICAGRDCEEGIRLGKDMELAEIVYDTEDESSAGPLGLKGNQHLVNQK